MNKDSFVQQFASHHSQWEKYVSLFIKDLYGEGYPVSVKERHS